MIMAIIRRRPGGHHHVLDECFACDDDDDDDVLLRIRRERVSTSPYSAEVADDRESDSCLQGQSDLDAA
jgi:hypothetical protein